MKLKLRKHDVGTKNEKCNRASARFDVKPRSFDKIQAAIDQIYHLHQSIGNRSIAGLMAQRPTPRNFSPDRGDPQAIAFSHCAGAKAAKNPLELMSAILQRNIGTDEGKKKTKCKPPSEEKTLHDNPTGIAKTEVETQKLHFGARYKHTLTSSGSSLKGVCITEKVTKVKDDFETKSKGVPLGKYQAEVNAENQISDRIWISFGAIAPAVKRLRQNKEPWEMLIGSCIDHQELYYRKEGAKPAWEKFADVTIEQRLYDVPGLVVVTLDNKKMADQENFTPFAPKRKK